MSAEVRDAKFLLFTHIRPDLDACSSVWLAERFMPLPQPVAIVFVPANSKVEDLDAIAQGRGYLALDLSCGIKGDVVVEDNGSKRVLSAFSKLREDLTHTEASLLARYSRALDIHDSTGSLPRSLVPAASEDALSLLTLSGMASIFACLVEGVHAQALEGKESDPNVSQAELDTLAYQAWGLVMDGMLRRAQNAIKNEERATLATWFSGRNGRVALIRGQAHTRVSGTLMNQGAAMVVFVDEHNLGATRSKSCSVNMLDLTRHIIDEAGELEEWFHHDAGFLLARGTQKAPQTTTSKVSPEAFAQALADGVSEHTWPWPDKKPGEQVFAVHYGKVSPPRREP